MDDEYEGSPIPFATAAEQLSSLDTAEVNIAKVLRRASTVMSLLTLPVPVPKGEEVSPEEGHDLTPEEREKKLNKALEDYFGLLENIHLNIKTILSALRAQRVSPALLMDAAHKDPPTYGASLPKEGEPETAQTDDATLGLYEKRVLRDAWRNIAGAMESLRISRQAEHSAAPEGPADGDLNPP